MSAHWINSELIIVSCKGQEGGSVKPFLVQIYIKADK